MCKLVNGQPLLRDDMKKYADIISSVCAAYECELYIKPKVLSSENKGRPCKTPASSIAMHLYLYTIFLHIPLCSTFYISRNLIPQALKGEKYSNGQSYSYEQVNFNSSMEGQTCSCESYLLSGNNGFPANFLHTISNRPSRNI